LGYILILKRFFSKFHPNLYPKGKIAGGLKYGPGKGLRGSSGDGAWDGSGIISRTNSSV